MIEKRQSLKPYEYCFFLAFRWLRFLHVNIHVLSIAYVFLNILKKCFEIKFKFLTDKYGTFLFYRNPCHFFVNFIHTLTLQNGSVSKVAILSFDESLLCLDVPNIYSRLINELNCQFPRS